MPRGHSHADRDSYTIKKKKTIIMFRKQKNTYKKESLKHSQEMRYDG